MRALGKPGVFFAWLYSGNGYTTSLILFAFGKFCVIITTSKGNIT